MIYWFVLSLLAILIPVKAEDSNQNGWTPAPGSTGNLLTYKWVSPKDKDTYVIWTDDKNTYKVDAYKDGEKKNVKNIESTLSADYLGFGSLPQRSYKWVDGDILVTKDQNGVGVLDVRQGRFIINNAFLSFLEMPEKGSFIVLPKRAIPRHGTFDYSSFSDELYLIDLNRLNLSVSSFDPRVHFTKSINLNGMMVSPFLSLKGRNQVGFLAVIDSTLHAIEIDGETLTIIKDVKINDPVPVDILQAGGLDKNLLIKYKANLNSL